MRLARDWGAALARAASRLGDRGYFPLLGAAGFVLSLGPVLRVAGHRLPIPLPYALLYFAVPGFSSMRASGRFAVLTLTASAVLAGLGYEWCRRRVARRGRGREAGLFALALAAGVLGAYSAPLPTVEYPHRATMPAIYEWLARQPGDFAVLDLPVPAQEKDEGPRDTRRQIYSLYHGKAIVDGVSGFVPPSHKVFRTLMQRFPEPATLRAAAARGARLIIVHYDDWPPGERERVRREAARAHGLKPVAELGSDVAYRVEAPRR